jgi:lipoprotein
MTKLKKLYIFIILTSVITLSACKDDKDEPNSSQSASVEYYIMYELKTSSRYSYHTLGATITTEKGVVNMTIPRNWEGTFGPFNKFENIVFSIKCSPSYLYNTSTFNGRISICRGNQPYILKADKTISNAPLSMNYQITKEDLK